MRLSESQESQGKVELGLGDARVGGRGQCCDLGSNEIAIPVSSSHFLQALDG